MGENKIFFVNYSHNCELGYMWIPRQWVEKAVYLDNVHHYMDFLIYFKTQKGEHLYLCSWLKVSLVKRPVFTVDILTCQSTKCTGGISYINDGCIECAHSRTLVLLMLIDMSYWKTFRMENGASVYAVGYTSASPAVTSQYICCKESTVSATTHHNMTEDR